MQENDHRAATLTKIVDGINMMNFPQNIEYSAKYFARIGILAYFPIVAPLWPFPCILYQKTHQTTQKMFVYVDPSKRKFKNWCRIA